MYTISKQNVDAKRNKNQFYHDLNLVAISLMLPTFSEKEKNMWEKAHKEKIIVFAEPTSIY